jgi:hypothetical protein
MSIEAALQVLQEAAQLHGTMYNVLVIVPLVMCPKCKNDDQK